VALGAAQLEVEPSAERRPAGLRLYRLASEIVHPIEGDVFVLEWD
jgi:hypothetical protein